MSFFLKKHNFFGYSHTHTHTHTYIYIYIYANRISMLNLSFHSTYIETFFCTNKCNTINYSKVYL